MPASVPLRVSRSGGEKGYRRAIEEVSSVRQAATALRARGSVESSPSRWRKASASSFPSVAAKCAFARWVRSLSEASSGAWRVTEREAWKSRSRPRCTSSRRRVTSSRAISASEDRVRPLLMERLWADSKRTFCHSSVRAACSAGMDPRWSARSMGAPAVISPWRKPGASERGQRPRCRERARWSPSRRSRRFISTSTGCASSRSAGVPPRAAASSRRRRARPFRGWTERPARASSD